ncbi:MAG: hypothetical protein JWN45_1191 [Acidobacteriaceae bacterium]|nr:hypothetical protein [Acidobacteriaceae bacterium]
MPGSVIRRNIAIFLVSFAAFIVFRQSAWGPALFISAFLKILAAMWLTVLLADWQWMDRSFGYRPLELVLKSLTCAVVFGMALLGMKLTHGWRGPLLDLSLGFLSVFGLIGTLFMGGCAFAVSRYS